MFEQFCAQVECGYSAAGKLEGARLRATGGILKRALTATAIALSALHLQACARTSPEPVKPSFRTPLVLDLDGDGVDIIQLWDASIHFDFDGDGFREKTTWLGRDDGFLVFDRNRNGSIEDSSELFGTNPTDFEEIVLDRRASGRLQRFDTNRDGMLTSADRRFKDLRIWRDLNDNGESEPGELKALASEGIQSIDLDYRIVNENLGDAYVTKRARFTRIDGTTAETADVWFRTLPSAAWPVQQVEATESVRQLPYIGSSGLVHNLHSAMELDPALRQMVAELVAMPPEHLDQFDWRVEAIFLRWTRAERVRPKSRGKWIDARRLVALERWTGDRFHQHPRGFTSKPLPGAAGALAQNYRDRLSRMGLQLFGQIEAGDVLLPEFEYAMDAFYVLKADYSAEKFISRAAQHSPQDPKRQILYWRNIVRLADELVDEAGYYPPGAGPHAVPVDAEPLAAAIDRSLARINPQLTYASLKRLNSEPRTALPDI